MKQLCMLVLSLIMFTGAYGAAIANPELSGKVVETMNSGGYTYVCLENNGTKTWVAVTEMKVVKGQTMAFKPGAVMENFESKTMKRKFDRIIFSDGPLPTKGAKAAAPKGAKAENQSAGSKAAVVKPAEKIKVEKASAPNAYTVADVYKNISKLNNKEVTVKGKVVKVSSGIMQKNWIHVQDGTGDAKKGTHNLVFTSQELPSVGDIVTMSGTAYKDKDFGMGYKYQVIVENASIKK